MAKTKEIYRSFEGRLDGDTRNGFVISVMDSGNLRLEEFSIYSDVKEHIYYVTPTDKYNAETVFTDKTAAEFASLVDRHVIYPYHTKVKRGG